MRRIIVVAVVSTSIWASGCGGGVAEEPLAHKTPAQVLKAALAAALKSAAAQYTLISKGPAKGQVQTLTGVSGIRDARQVTVAAGARWEALVADGKVFTNDDPRGLEDEGYSASVAAIYGNRWIAIAPTDSPYHTILAEVALYPVLEELAPTGSLTLTPTTTRDGRQVIGVRGSVRTNTGSSAKGTATLFVSVTAPTIPIAYAGVATDNGQTVTESGTFTAWGNPISVSAPENAVAFSSIPTGS